MQGWGKGCVGFFYKKRKQYALRASHKNGLPSQRLVTYANQELKYALLLAL